MKLRFFPILAAMIAASSLNASAVDERNGRVIPLAKPTIFGYTQIIGDRLCLFDTDCRPIADYSAYSTVKTDDGFFVCFSVDDGSNIYFYNAKGMLFLTLTSGTEYVQYEGDVTFKTDTGYNCCTDDGETYMLSYETAKAAADVYGYGDDFTVRFEYGSFYVSGGRGYAPILSALNKSDASASKTEPSLPNNYRIEEAVGDGRYIISRPVGHSDEYGICDSSGRVLIKPQFSVLSRLSNGMWDICSTHSYDSYKYAIEKEVTENPNFIYDEVSTDFGDGLVGVIMTDENGKRRLYLNENLEPVIDLSHTDYRLKTFKNGRAVCDSDKYGDCIIDLNGDTLLRAYDFAKKWIVRNKNLVYFDETYIEGCDTVVYLPPDTPPVTEHIIPPDNGEPKQPYYSTDIRVTIDGEPIPSYAVDGKMMISLDALAEHGFLVSYHNDTRTFIADRDTRCENKASAVATGNGTVGEQLGYTVKSDIGAYINGKYIETEAIDGELLVEAEALCALPAEDDPDYWMLNYLGISPYLMSGEYNDSTRTLSIHTYTEENVD